MIMIEANNGGRLNKRPIKDFHADLKTVPTSFGLNDSLDYFEIAMGKKKIVIPRSATVFLRAKP